MNTEQKTLPQLDEKFKTCFCRWDGDIQIQQCTLHKAHIDAIHEWAERARAAETKLKEQRDWEAVAAGRAMTIAMLKSEQYPVGQVINERGEVDWISFVPNAGTELYASSPAQRKPLTDEEIENIIPDDDTPMSLGEAFVKFARAIEAAHGIKEQP